MHYFLLISDTDYNNDYVYDEDNNLSEDNATLEGWYYSNKTYLIVLSKYNITDIGSNISIYFYYYFS